jgi:hypothetical protein
MVILDNEVDDGLPEFLAVCIMIGSGLLSVVMLVMILSGRFG